MFAPLDPVPPVTSAPQPASLIEDLIDVWFAPASVFARRPQAAAWGPFVVTALLLGVLYFGSLGAMQGVFDAEAARAIAEAQADNPSMTTEQVEAMRGVVETSIKYGGLVVMPVVLLLVGLGVWLVGRALGGTLTFAGGVMIASLAYLPKALELLLAIVQSFVLDTSTWSGRYQFSWGVGRFLEPTMPQGIYNLLGRLDVFTIWVTALCVLGLVHAAKVPKARAWTAGAILWALGALPALLQITKGA